MRCLIVVPSLMRAGAETQAVDLANGLAARGHSIHVCSFEPNLDQRKRLAAEVNYHHVRREAKYDLRFANGIAKIINGEGIEVVQGVLMFGMYVAWISSKRSLGKPPVIAAVHTTVNRGIKQELQDRLLYRRILRRLPAVVFVCDYQRDFWVRKYPELASHSHVIHNGVDPKRFNQSDYLSAARHFRRELKIPGSAFVFTCIAGFRPEKGHRLLIKAFSRIASESYLLLAGDGPERRGIEEAIRASKIGDRVRLLGNIPDVRPLIVASNATVLASTAVETFSMAMLESMALGVPMIAPRIAGLPEAITHGETGMLFPIGDLEALSTGMKQMVEVPEQVQALGQAAAKRVRSSFTLMRMIDGSERVLESVAYLQS